MRRRRVIPGVRDPRCPDCDPVVETHRFSSGPVSFVARVPIFPLRPTQGAASPTAPTTALSKRRAQNKTAFPVSKTRFLIEAEGTRTLNLRIDSPPNENCKSLSSQPLTSGRQNDLASILARFPELTTLIERWPDAAPEVRDAILRMISEGGAER